MHEASPVFAERLSQGSSSRERLLRRHARRLTPTCAEPSCVEHRDEFLRTCAAVLAGPRLYSFETVQHRTKP